MAVQQEAFNQAEELPVSGKEEKKPVSVKTMGFFELLEDSWPLALDSYQRGFVWGTAKVEQLIGDLNTYQVERREEGDALPYYMGTLLLHNDTDKKRRFIIDGQQRITALSLLYYQIKQEFPHGQKLSYSAQSARCIEDAVKLLKNSSDIPAGDVFDRLHFTVITVTNPDLAFAFFDTQNNRGVRLQATDLLKAYHLRSIDHNSNDKVQGEELQKDCATRWEKIQRQSSVFPSGKDWAPNLFGRFLWRARRWQGKHVLPADHEGLLEEFQGKSWPQSKDSLARVDTVPIYACRDNQLASAMSVKGGEITLSGGSSALGGSAAGLPIALRQPIHEGLGFFLYADKYAALIAELRDETSPNPEIKEFQHIHDSLLMSNQVYLREAFWVAVLMYVDQFGYRKLMEFSLSLEFILGAIRLEKMQVKVETAANFFRDGRLNLLDVIAQSYHPDQVLDYLSSQHSVFLEHYEKNDVELGKGVRGEYAKSVLYFYFPSQKTHPKNLAGKLNWMKRRMEPDNDH